MSGLLLNAMEVEGRLGDSKRSDGIFLSYLIFTNPELNYLYNDNDDNEK